MHRPDLLLGKVVLVAFVTPSHACPQQKNAEERY
jgi:hypothetical protein